MSQFIQIHMLTSFPPSNLNRDNLGRPKSARMGGTDRLRISSQSLKRAWRTSDLFQSALADHLGTRTKRLGIEAYKALVEGGVKEKDAREWGKTIAGQFGALKKKEGGDKNADLEIEQLVHVSPEERNSINQLVASLIAEKRAPEGAELNLLRAASEAADIALFGRMLAAHKQHNVEAACQVAHAISVHPVVIEDDYFTAVDDLNQDSADAGAAHIGETGFSAALFYSYICINKDLLVENLGGDQALAEKTIRALTEAAAKIPPTGKQNSFASRAYASYVLVEKGEEQPRSLSGAFLKAIDKREEKDFGEAAVRAITEHRTRFDTVFDTGTAPDRYEINVLTGEGSFQQLMNFAADE